VRADAAAIAISPEAAWQYFLLFRSARPNLAIFGSSMECAPDGGQFAGWELTRRWGFQRMKAMAKHRTHSV
jgi:hypothetical protein